MQLSDLLDEGLSFEEVRGRISPAELRIMSKLAHDFSIEPTSKLYEETIRALYRFKQVLRHYHTLYLGQSVEIRSQLSKVFLNLQFIDSNSRRCFSNSFFFGPIRFLLRACKLLKVPIRVQERYLELVYEFPVTPFDKFDELVQSEITTCNLPHIYIWRVAGSIRDQLTNKKTPLQIIRGHQRFLREMNVSKAHATWYGKSRLSGSFESRK